MDTNLRTIQKLINNFKFKIIGNNVDKINYKWYVDNLDKTNYKWYIIIDQRHVIGYNGILEYRSDIIFELSEIIDFRTIQVATKAEAKRFFYYKENKTYNEQIFDPDWYVGG